MDDIKKSKANRARIAPLQRRSYIRGTAAPDCYVGPPQKPITLSVIHEPAATTSPKIQRRKIRVRLSFVARIVRPIRVLIENAELRSIPSELRQLSPSHRKYPVIARIGWGLSALAVFASVGIEMFDIRQQTVNYSISPQVSGIIGQPNDRIAQSLRLDPKTQAYEFNQGYQAAPDMSGNPGPRFTATFPADPTKGTVVTDPVNKISVTLKPKFTLKTPSQDKNRLVYPISGTTAQKIYTLKSVGFKEDIILNNYQGDDVAYEYDLQLPSGTEARLEKNGSLAIYGVESTLLGNVTTGNEKDAKLLESARNNGKKTNLLFTLPAPYVKEVGKTTSQAKAWFTHVGTTLTLHASGLKQAQYPLSIDPSIYIETAAKLMLGNNETNIDFDPGYELIQKSQTTGARIDSWSSTTNLSTAVWGQGTAVAGGYIYSAGGAGAGNTVSTVYNAAGQTTYNVPAGVSRVTVKAWGAGGAGGAGTNGGTGAVGGNGGGGGYAKATISVTGGEALTVRVGTGGSVPGANGRAGNGGGYSAVLRGATFLVEAGGGGGGGGRRGGAGGTTGSGGAGGGLTGQSGTVGSTGSPGQGGTQAAGGAGGTGTASGVAGASNAGGNGTPTAACATAATGTGGAGGTGAGGAGGTFVTTCAPGGGGGGGRFGGGGGASTRTNARTGGGGGGGSSYVNPTGLISGTDVLTQGANQAPGNNGDSDRAGLGDGGTGGVTSATTTAGDSGVVVISYVTPGAVTNQVSWAKFNTTSNAIESPNPGSGTCSGWCTDSAYNLPQVLQGLSLVAYNGFLYAIGGSNSSGTPQSTVYIAKLGANGEPQLWHPSGGTPVYWYADTSLPEARSQLAAVAYNNRLYVVGGLSAATTVLASNTVRVANINPMGTLTTWSTTGMQGLATPRYGITAHIYNDTMYVLGGNATFSGTPVVTVMYSRINSDGTMNAWQTSTSMSGSGRMTLGGSFSTILGGYVYIAGGCTTVNASGYCTAFASDIQLASINADGSLSEWNTMLGVTNDRFAHTLIAWQGGLYRLGGCRDQDAGTGSCMDTVFDVDYGVVNSDGDASTVATSVASGTGSCTGGSPYGCNLPGTANIGNLLTSAAIVNGYLYIIGGCRTNDCGVGDTSGNTVYTRIADDGSLVRPATCPGGTAVDSYCVDSTDPISGGVAAAGTAVFNDRIYVYGGMNGSALKNTVYNVPINADGSLNGTWNAQSITGLGMTSVSYTYVYARANPAQAATVPGHFFVFGGCTAGGSIGCSGYTERVFRCEIQTSGSLGNCTFNTQLQIGTVTGASSAGLAAHAGTVYANYIYLIGGLAPDLADLSTVRYAKFDNNNNVVAASGSAWTVSSTVMNNGRRRAAGFGYNGYIYVVGGYDATTGILADIEFAQINVSDGSLRGTGTGGVNLFDQSSVSVNQRWGLTVPVSNSYAFVIGGCTDGQSPTCNVGGPTNTVQTFQLYNNDSGAIKPFTAGTSTGVDRIGGSATILNGYIYYAGGCTDVACTALSNAVYSAPIDAYGVIGAWSLTNSMPTTPGGVSGARAWGKLLAVGGGLYYVGGQTSSAVSTATSSILYTTSVSGGTVNWSPTDSNWGIGNTGSGGQPRTQFGAAVWDNMMFITGGYDATGAVRNTVFASPIKDNGGSITTAWTSTTAFNVNRVGHTTIAYANNLYILGGYTGSAYLNDTQYTQINIDSVSKRPNGTVDPWTYSTSLPNAVRDADGFAANGYIYLVGGRTAVSTCTPSIAVAPISANTTIATGNNPTGFGEWYETSVNYTGSRYGAAAVYTTGKMYVLGGGCSSMITGADRSYYATIKSQPQVAEYSRMIDTDTDVFPTKWLMNGIDNSTGARWQLKYRSMHDLDGVVTPNEDCGVTPSAPTMTTWGQETNYGNVTLSSPAAYIPKDASGNNMNCARYFYFSVSVDASQTFGYPDDVSRGPTIDDLSLFFTSDPSKRMLHGKTFTGGLQQPLDTPIP